MSAGHLAQDPPSELLRRLAADRVTGCLRIRRGDLHALVYFRAGAIYTAAAPEARARLGDRLVGAGHITEDQLADVLAVQRSLATPPRIGELVVQGGLIDRDTMRAYVREQIADSVAAALAWTEGEWRFDAGEQVAEDAPLDLSVENLLMEGARRLEEWDVIRARLGSLAAIVDFVASGSQAELSLTPDEWTMLTRIDGASSVEDIAADSGYGQFEAARIIYGLLTAGVVTLVDEAPGTLSAAPTDPPASVPPPAADIDRNQLLREFAALDAADDAPITPRPPAPPPAPAARRTVPAQPAEQAPARPTPTPPARKAGLLGRFRKRGGR